MSRPEESEQRQLARNLSELLQELRVAQGGVQILFGFLLSIAFSDRYEDVDGYIRVLHLVTVVLAAAAVALLTAPASWHRLLFRQGMRKEIIDTANVFAITGMVFLALAMIGTVLLLGEAIVGGWPAIVIGVFALVGFGMLWFVLPLLRRRDS
ncbi:DUF6328 family protein [Allokutzneria albata]|uniref:Sodium:proton antiporter n=1 Tax=Allokutzneria albata TaxID=211114 RepID=A0A1G9UT42_ALLAB|nr:DUF6328 family protein [Allokutzneria albata]SDM62967.1 hypothetical protein SAMN04489726_2599 [Allokutzneria albata]